jgi:hypothetical protein
MTNNNEPKPTTIMLAGDEVKIAYVETTQVKEGVSCDVYRFAEDNSKDLAIVTVTQGAKTPLQRVVRGISTIEGFYDGAGTLTVKLDDGTEQLYRFEPGDNARMQAGIQIEIGQQMQWAADKGEDLVFYEVCDPPYEDGRFVNLPD